MKTDLQLLLSSLTPINMDSNYKLFPMVEVFVISN